jgi:hypothetical protein
MSAFGRITVGCMGGLAAVATKYLGQDHAYFLRLLDLDDRVKIANLLFGYEIMAPFLIFLGGLVGWASYENHRLKLLAIAVAAPALITTWAGGATTATKFALDLISPAHAQGTASDAAQASPSAIEGIKLFFGIGKDEERYRVIAGTFKDRMLAQAKAEAIHKFDPAWNVHVLQPKSGAEQWTVVVGDYLPYPEAKQLKASIVGAKLTNDVFITSSPWP